MTGPFRCGSVSRALLCIGLWGAGVTTVISLAARDVNAAKGAPEPVRMSAADALKKVVELELERGAATDLLVFMKHPDAQVRARAALALGRLQDWHIVENMVEFLGDPDPQVRKNTAFALGEMDPVLPLLVAQIKQGRKGDDPNVRGPAMARAAAEKKLDARLHLEERPDVRKALYAALGPMAIGAGLHHLQFGLESGNDEAAWAARALGVHGHRRRNEAVQSKEVMDALYKLLSSENDDARFGATYALFRLKSKEINRLGERLGTDTDARVRLYAARALGNQAGGEAALMAALRDPDWRVRVEAMRSMASVPKPRGVYNAQDVEVMAKAGLDALQAFTSNSGLTQAPMAHVVIAAAEALAKAPPSVAAPHLEAMAAFFDGRRTLVRPPVESWQVRCAIALSQDAVTGAPNRVLTCGDPREPAFRQQLRAVDVVVTQPGSDGEKARRLAAYLRHADAHVRLRAAERMADLDVVRAPDVPELLAEQLEEETDPGAAGTMADGLKRHPAPQFVKSLRPALKRFSTMTGDGAEATVNIVEALAACQGKEAVDEIKPLLTHSAARVRTAAATSLAQLGQKVPAQPLREPVMWPAQTLPSRVTLKTQKGDVVIRLYRDDAPLTVTNFVALAKKGLYKNTAWHRVVSDFVVQGGDPRGDGFGGPGYTIPCEYNARPYERGVVGMALGGKDSGGSQFFITHSPQPHLDGMYTAFGEVESGMEVIDSLLQDDLLLDVVLPP